MTAKISRMVLLAFGALHARIILLGVIILKNLSLVESASSYTECSLDSARLQVLVSSHNELEILEILKTFLNVLTKFKSKWK